MAHNRSFMTTKSGNVSKAFGDHKGKVESRQLVQHGIAASFRRAAAIADAAAANHQPGSRVMESHVWGGTSGNVLPLLED